MFDSETSANLATIINWGRKHFPKRAIIAFWPMAKDLIAVIANGITSGVPIDDWESDVKLAPIVAKLHESGNHFFDVLGAEFPGEVK